MMHPGNANRKIFAEGLVIKERRVGHHFKLVKRGGSRKTMLFIGGGS